MSPDLDSISIQLNEACKVSGVRWAIWLMLQERSWVVHLPCTLSKRRRLALQEFIQLPAAATWLAGALSSGRIRSRNTGAFANTLGCQRLYLFPNPKGRALILAGADLLGKEDKAFFRVLALNEPSAQPDQMDSQVNLEFRSLDPDSAILYHLNDLLEHVLKLLVEAVGCNAAYIAIRSGDMLQIGGVWGFSLEARGLNIAIQENPLHSRIIETRQGIIEGNLLGMSDHTGIDHLLTRPAKSVLAVPILISRRVIGEIVFISYRSRAFSPSQKERVTSSLAQFGPSIERAIIFGEATRYLEQFVLLNELASAASAGEYAHEIARRVVRKLRQTFQTEGVAVLLLSQDGKSLVEYGGRFDASSDLIIPVENSMVGYVVEHGLPVRVGDIRDAPRFLEDHLNARSAMAVPLKYRGKVIGAIDLESSASDAFSAQDEQLLIVVASHLAGLLENARLHEETRERARNLTLIHKVVQQIVGLTEVDQISQVTAELMAQYFNYEFALVLLAEPQGETLVAQGVGGEIAHLMPRGFKYPTSRGITGQVYRSGRSYYSNDVTQVPVYFSIPGWQAASEMCVPLWQGDSVIGLINVESAQANVFSDSDLLMLESLAGILSSVMMSAQRHQELQERIKAQKIAESRLIRSARLAAVGEMAAGVAHELNNPLTTIIGFVELAVEDLPPEISQRADLELVLREAQRTRSVVRRLLDFSRQGENVWTTLDINDLVKEVITLMQHLIQTGGINLGIDCQPDLPLIYGDSSQIKQVLLNLLQNALQAMPGGGTLSLQTRTSRSKSGNDREGVLINVRDSGEGIPPENIERIFEPFFTTRPVGSGTGLGLSVSYGIIVNHGGYLEVESQVGEGSSFTIWLPVGNGRNVL